MGEVFSLSKLLEQGKERLCSDLADQPLARASFLQTIGSALNILGLAEQMLPACP